jgi:hypothetical protein
MRLRDVNRALRAQGCEVKRDTGRHTTWNALRRAHRRRRHNIISPGVVRDTISRMECLPEG